MRLVLLALLAFGVLGMHTAGHEGMAPHSPGAAHAIMHTGETTAALVAGKSGPAGEMTMIEMCLAIVGLGLLLALAFVLTSSVAGSSLLSGQLLCRGRPGRGPPGLPIGRRLASVSVMRT